METAEIIKIFNLGIALVTLYPSFGLAKYLIQTRALNDGSKRLLNRRLAHIFIVFVAMAIVNSVLYIAGIFNVDGRHELASARSTIINTLFAWGVWGLYLFQKEEFKR